MCTAFTYLKVTSRCSGRERIRTAGPFQGPNTRETMKGTEGERDDAGAGLMETVTIDEMFVSLQGESGHSGRPCIFVRFTGCNLRCPYCDTKHSWGEESAGDTRPPAPDPGYDHDRYIRGNGESWYLQDVISRIQELSVNHTGGKGADAKDDLKSYPIRLVEFTGGEPCLQAEPLRKMVEVLTGNGWTVLVETNGTVDIEPLRKGLTHPERLSIIMDHKLPSSGIPAHHLLVTEENLDHLTQDDELKFVIRDRLDLDAATEMIGRWRRRMGWGSPPVPILFSPVLGPSGGDGPGICNVPGGVNDSGMFNGPDLTWARELAEQVIQRGLPGRFQLQLHKILWGDERGK